MAYLSAKTWTGYQTNLKFGMQWNFVVLWEKPQNNFLVPDPVHCENGIWKIQIFDVIFSSSRYLMWCFEASVQLIPKSYSHPSCSLLELQLILVQIGLPHLAIFNWSPNIYQKWNWAENKLQILCLKLSNLLKMGAKEEKSLLAILLKGSHIVQWFKQCQKENVSFNWYLPKGRL